MALADFIQSLQEQDTIYSTPPQPSIRVIPPESQSIKIIPPETISTNSAVPKVIKLKIKTKPADVEQPTQPVVVQEQPISNNILKPVNRQSNAVSNNSTTVNISNNTPTVKQDIINKPQDEPIMEQSEKVQITTDDIFNSTGTEYSKKQIWLEYYEKAKNSRKSNPIVDRMKVGRFTITPDNKVLLLPDYDVVGKDPDDILKDKWF